jgi:peptidoglycan hydrolase-like protein with peptidoglycan-binding domain
MRSLSLVAAMTALTLSAGALAAQSTSNQQPASKSTMNQASVHATQDTTKKAAAAAKPSSTTVKHATYTKEQIKEAQEGLAKLGLYKGKPNGKLDSNTQKALKEYQKENKLPVTGKLSDTVLTKLKSA